MSIDALDWVFRASKSTGSDRLVLLSIANHADENGASSFPSVKRIADETRLSERAIRRSIAALRELNDPELEVTLEVFGRGRRNTYRVLMTGCQPDRVSKRQGGRANLSGGRVPTCQGEGANLAPPIRTVNEPSVQPSSNRGPSPEKTEDPTPDQMRAKAAMVREVRKAIKQKQPSKAEP